MSNDIIALPNTVAILLPDVSSKVTLSADWFQQRDALVARGKALVAVTDPLTADEAGEQVRRLGKLAKALEDQRKKITDPFLKAQKLIKARVDAELVVVEAEVERLKQLLGAFAAKQQAAAEAEAKAAEEARRAEVERQVAEMEKLNAQNQLEDDKEAELLGTDPAVFQPAPVEIVVPDAPVVAAPAKIDGVRVITSLAFEVIDEAEVPRRFLCVDPGLIRSDLQAHKDEYMAKIKDDPTWSPIAGVRVRIETKVGSR